MANKKITELQLRDNVTADLNIPGDDGIQTYRVTAQQIKDYILANDAIATAMIQALSVTNAKIANSTIASAKTNFTAPTVQVFKSGSGTYTLPSGVKRIIVSMVGGGGSGSAGATTGASANGNDGTTSTFGSSLLIAGNGRGGAYASIAGSVANTINSPAIEIINVLGGNGQTGGRDTQYVMAGMGGSSYFGGAGGAVLAGAGGNAIANTGGGGAGGAGSAGTTLSTVSGSGGSAGSFLKALINSPSSSYSYSVGSGGASKTGEGATGQNSGAGGSGIIIVEEFYE